MRVRGSNEPSNKVFDNFADNEKFLLKEIIVVHERSGDNTDERLSA